ncbi:FHA domain-containing protein [Myxococcota bacterium]
MNEGRTSTRSAEFPPNSEPTRAGADGVRRRCYWLDYRGHRVELRIGTTVIGRSAGCQLVLDDALVSRRHAQLVLTGDEVRLEDLGSANGVFLNGDRVNGNRVLSSGDRLVVGQQELVLRVGQADQEVRERFRSTAVTLSGSDTDKVTGVTPSLPPREGEIEATQQSDALHLLGGVADKVLALGRGEEAERILGALLRNVLTRAQSQGRLDESLADKAAEYAVKIATVTGGAKWVDYSVELFTAVQRPMPAAVVDQLYTVLRTVIGINRIGLRDYAATMRAVQERFGPAERFLIQRIQGLERLASLK